MRVRAAACCARRAGEGPCGGLVRMPRPAAVLGGGGEEAAQTHTSHGCVKVEAFQVQGVPYSAWCTQETGGR